MKMRVLVVIAVLMGILAFNAPVVQAQTLGEIQFQYQQVMKQLIDLLLKQIAELQAQVAALIKAQQQAQMGIPSWPRGIEEATNKNISDEGVLLPSVILQARITKYIRTLVNDWEDEWQVGKEIAVGVTNGRPDDLEILISVGNPDDDYEPTWTCEKLGNWSGPAENSDHWERVENPIPGEYRVRCGASEDYVIVKEGKKFN